MHFFKAKIKFKLIENIKFAFDGQIVTRTAKNISGVTQTKMSMHFVNIIFSFAFLDENEKFETNEKKKTPINNAGLKLWRVYSTPIWTFSYYRQPMWTLLKISHNVHTNKKKWHNNYHSLTASIQLASAFWASPSTVI